MDFAGAEMSAEDMRAQILHYECEIDKLVETGEVSEEEAWDAYFGLLHECDLWGFLEERERIVSKIDTTRYNPFKSKDPRVHIIARSRMIRLNISPPSFNN